MTRPVRKIIYWDDVSDPSNHGWVLRTEDEDVQLDAPEGDWEVAAVDAAKYLGWNAWELGPDDMGTREFTRAPTALTMSKRLQTVGNSLCIIIDRSVADELGVDRGDWVEFTIRRVK